MKWIQELIIDRVYIENVEEFLAWGPVDDKGNIIKSKKGEIFKKFIGMIKAFGYRVEYRILNAADFGAPTCRKRLIIQAARGKEKICWPEPTHVKDPGLLEGLYKSWVPARDIIDWDIPGKSIFDRKKPLVPNTLRRIYSGIVKYWGAAANLYTPLVRQEIIRSCQTQNTRHRSPFHANNARNRRKTGYSIMQGNLGRCSGDQYAKSCCNH